MNRAGTSSPLSRQDHAASSPGRPAGVAAVLVLVLLGGLLGVVPAASAQTVDLRGADTLQLEGRGYGHGRGMSQNGAEGAARSGLGHRQILDFYYPGTTAYDPGDPLVRVRLTGSQRQDANGSYVRLSGNLLALDDVAGHRSTVLPAGTASCVVRRSGPGVTATCSGGAAPVTLQAGSVRLRAGAGGAGVQTGSSTTRFYRGAIVVVPDGSGLVAVAHSTMQEYLRGVVPLEIPASWHREALRTQAVAARTYALRGQRDAPASRAWDLCDTTQCQVFNGMRTVSGGLTTTHERSTTDAAVADTAGLALRHAGIPAFTQFSAANGGWSVASPTQPYLTARSDPYDGVTGSTSHRWSTAVPVSRIRSAWPAVGTPHSLTVLSRDGNGEWGGRVRSLTVTGSAGSVTVTGEAVRTALGLRSSWFTFTGAPAPAPPPPAPPVDHDPDGALSSVSPWQGGLAVSGWAADPDSTAPTRVHLYVNGGFAAAVEASVAPPPGAVVPAVHGGSRGFAHVLPVTTAGTWTVCAYAINVGAGTTNTTLGCRTTTMGADPRGALDGAQPGFRSVDVRGWAWDADSTGPTRVHVYVDGRPVASVLADSARADVARALPAAGGLRGYLASVPATSGKHRVCTYGINSGPGTNRLLGCRDVVVSADPVGELETGQPHRAAVELSGWAADPDTATAVDVVSTVSGATSRTSASSTRPDLQQRLRTSSPDHGFVLRAPAMGGTQQACSRAVNLGPGADASLGCLDVLVGSEPFGHLDAADRSGDRVTVRGWALDPDVVQPVTVHVYADGRFVGMVTAASPRPDVAGVHPLHGQAHGYSASLPLPGGSTRVCSYAIDVANPAEGTRSANMLLGCLPL